MRRTCLLLCAVAVTSTSGKAKQTIKAALEQDPDFSTLTSALSAAGLLDGLDGSEALFAPTNALSKLCLTVCLTACWNLKTRTS
jgi:uncharacterized surface protein with fasciclin (FAS1) repeats